MTCLPCALPESLLIPYIVSHGASQMLYVSWVTRNWAMYCVYLLCSHISSIVLLDVTLQNVCSKGKILKSFGDSDNRTLNQAQGPLSMRSTVITQVASPWSWLCCQHNFILDNKAKSKDQIGIVCSLTLRQRDQPSFILQKTKLGLQPDYSKGRVNHCPKFMRVNLNRRPMKCANTDALSSFSALADSNFLCW